VEQEIKQQHKDAYKSNIARQMQAYFRLSRKKAPPQLRQNLAQ
jgi:hypothetical protein